MKGLTKRQKEILDFIQEEAKRQGYSPTFREIATHFNFRSLGTVFRHVQSLKKKCVLEGEKGLSRSLFVKEEVPPPTLSSEITLPLIGYLSKGLPIETFPQSRHIAVPAFFVSSPENTYVLRVRGDSLQDEMIQDGDLLVVEARRLAEPGEIVVAALNEHETVVKKYYPEGDYIRLLSQNPAVSPLMLRHNHCTIQAVLVALFRLF